MAHRKAGGSTKNLTDSNPKYLGVKRGDGSAVKSGEIIVRQRGTKIGAGQNVKIGRDHTLFAVSDGTVAFRSRRRKRFDGNTIVQRVVDVRPALSTESITQQ